MKTLRSMSISRRLWLILVVAVAMLVVLGLLMLRQIHGDLYQAKAEKTRHVVQTAAGVLAYYQGLEAAGTLSREAAQQQALQVVRALRYDHDDYFWINDLGPRMIMHPANPKLDGQDLSAIRDPDALPCSTRWSHWPACRTPGRSTTAGPSPAPASQWPRLPIYSCSSPGAGSSGLACTLMMCRPNSPASCATPRW